MLSPLFVCTKIIVVWLMRIHLISSSSSSFRSNFVGASNMQNVLHIQLRHHRYNLHMDVLWLVRFAASNNLQLSVCVHDVPFSWLSSTVISCCCCCCCRYDDSCSDNVVVFRWIETIVLRDIYALLPFGYFHILPRSIEVLIAGTHSKIHTLHAIYW